MSFASDVRSGLAERPRHLPPRWFYDDLGSRIFDSLCCLPWYRITRAELSLLTAFRGEIRKSFGKPDLVVELGCGNGEKLVVLLEGLVLPGEAASVGLVDLSAEALSGARARLSARPELTVSSLRARYETGIDKAVCGEEGRILVAFLGSNIGNFNPRDTARFLRRIRRCLRKGDGFLLGADLVKDERTLLLAYDDPLGLTAAFNKNLLVRMNRELGADFDLHAFEHRAVWNAEASRVEMHLLSRWPQVVTIPGADLTIRLRSQETIFTEASYKYTPEGLSAMLEDAGFILGRTWTDHDALFSLSLFRVP